MSDCGDFDLTWVLSLSVSNALKLLNDPEVAGNATSCPMFDTFRQHQQFCLLQKWSHKWGAYVDVTTVGEIVHEDKLTVIPKPIKPKSISLIVKF